MITFTKEQLIASAHARIEFAEMMLAGELEPLKEHTWSIELELARIALASLEAEPAIHRWRRVTVEPYGPYPWHYGNFIGFSKPVEGIEDEYYYSAPPAPVSVPDELTREEYKRRFMEEDNFDDTFRGGWNAYRVAMLQSLGNSEQLNSPVIPDGWVMVPVEPTYQMCEAMGLPWESPRFPDRYKAMIAAAPHFRENAETSTKCWCRTCRPITLTDMRFVVCPVCGNKRCPHANDHRNACSGSNEPGQEGSAYPAAPQQEVK